MSFTNVVKNEVSKLPYEEIEAISELSAFIRVNYYDEEKIRFTSENASVARRIYQLLKNLYHITPRITVRKGYNFNRSLIYILEVHYKVLEILTSVGLYDQQLKGIPSSFVVDDDSLVRSYLRGIFMGTGSINDPKTSRYHLEFLVNDSSYAKFICDLLNRYYLNSKTLKRDNKYMIYMKESEKIGDFLRIIGAIQAILYFEDIRIYRDHKNMTNRLNNCEQANTDKVIETSDKQMEDIKIIEQEEGFDLLDDKVKEAILYRKKYPDASLQELSEIISLETGKELTKSGLYHRFRKIKKLADLIRERKKEH